MQYNVSQLLREPVGASRTYLVDDETTLPLDGDPMARVTGPLALIRTPSGLLARAELRTTVEVPCSRCVGPAALPLQLEFEEEYFPVIDPVNGGRLPDPEDSDAFRIDEWHHLDLTPAVSQAAVLAMPMRPLCREDCAGLCLECGADLNIGACACSRAPIDSRWAALRNLSVE